MTPLAPPIVRPPRGTLPVVLSVPHSGRDYPSWLLDLAAVDRKALESLEDPLVDRLAWRALDQGCAAVIARAPRAAVDCNRAEGEVDPAVVQGAGGGGRLSARARGGLGIVPGRTLHHGHLWRRPLRRAELEQRLDQAHRPYHRALEQQIDRLVERFGCALLLDCHSMPPPPSGVPPVVFGDRHGRTAEPWLSNAAFAVARRCGFDSCLNQPFAGGHVIDRHARPARGVHALQVEIDRRCYLDPRLERPGAGFDRTARLIERLSVELGEALLGRQFATAAE